MAKKEDNPSQASDARSGSEDLSAFSEFSSAFLVTSDQPHYSVVSENENDGKATYDLAGTIKYRSAMLAEGKPNPEHYYIFFT